MVVMTPLVSTKQLKTISSSSLGTLEVVDGADSLVLGAIVVVQEKLSEVLDGEMWDVGCGMKLS